MIPERWQEKRKKRKDNGTSLAGRRGVLSIGDCHLWERGGRFPQLSTPIPGVLESLTPGLVLTVNGLQVAQEILVCWNK